MGVQWFEVGGRATRVTPPTLSFTIQTHFGPGVDPGGPSGYGRGTTEEDRRARNTSLGFHEGTHGTACQQYLRDHPLPAFEGKTGMTIEKLQSLGEQHKAAVDEYVRRMVADVERQGDCVGEPAKHCATGTERAPLESPSPSPTPAPGATPQ